jgi:phosphatidylserine decarboxylase
MQGFSAWKVGLPYYGTLLGAGILLLAFSWSTPYWPIGAVVLVAGLFTLNFFRDPPRKIPAEASAIVSPADGKVVAIEEFATSEVYDGPCTRISIFLNVFNVHVNRSPYAGRVTDRKYKKGKFLNAMAPESSELNESAAIRLETTLGPMTVRQIAGLVARRIVCLPKVMDELEKGQRFGMIKFGSRTELYLPRDCVVRVEVGQNVKGGSSILAEKVPESTSS